MITIWMCSVSTFMKNNFFLDTNYWLERREHSLANESYSKNNKKLLICRRTVHSIIRLMWIMFRPFSELVLKLRENVDSWLNGLCRRHTAAAHLFRADETPSSWKHLSTLPECVCTKSIQITFICLRSSKNYYRRPILLQKLHKSGIRQMGTNVGGDIGGRVIGRLLIISTNEAFTISSGNLFQHGTTRTLKACWRRWVLHRYW